jgi:hypothetical protein
MLLNIISYRQDVPKTEFGKSIKVSGGAVVFPRVPFPR